MSDSSNPVQPGDVVFVDAGTYSDGFNLTSGDNDIVILGSEVDPAIIQGPVTITGASNITLEGLVLDGGVTLTDCTNVTLSDCTIGSGGVLVDGGSGVQIVHSTINTTGTGILITDGAVGTVIEHNQINGGAQGIAVGSGIAGLDVRFNQLSGSDTGIALTDPASGQICGNSVTSIDTALLLSAAFSGSINDNNFSGAAVGVAYQAGASLNANRIYNNTIGVASTVSDPASALGFVTGSQPNQIFDNVTGVQLTNAAMQNQHIYENQTGVSGSGNLVSDDLAHANVIEENSVGINFSGPIEFNKIDADGIGILASSDQLIAHNDIYGTTQTALEIQGQTDVRVFNNTFYSLTGDLIRVEDGSSEVDVQNNILWAGAGFDLYIADDSQSGFYSDYNDLYSTGAGKLVSWDGYTFTDILDWQQDVDQFDLHSIGTTVVNPTWAQPRFVGAIVGDFSVVDELAGLNFTSPTISGGDPVTDEGLPVSYNNTLTDQSLASSADNLLTNAGFEDGLSGWTATLGGGTTQMRGPRAYDGSSYFAPANNSETILTQTVSLADSGFTDAQIDTDNLDIVFGGRVRIGSQNPAATGTITITIYGSNGQVLQQYTAAASNTVDRWELVGASQSLPAGAKCAVSIHCGCQRRHQRQLSRWCLLKTATEHCPARYRRGWRHERPRRPKRA